MPAHLANGDNLSPFVTGQPSPIPGKVFSNALYINKPSKTAPTELANGDNLSPRVVQELGQPSPVPHVLLNKSLNINESSEAAPTQGPFLFSGTQEKAQPTVEFNPRLPTPKNGPSNIVNVNWPLPYTRTVGPVNEDGFAVVTQTWYDYSSMTSSDSQSPGSPRSFHFDPRSFPPPRTRTRVQYFGRLDGRARKKPRFVMGFRRGCSQCCQRVSGHRNHIIFT